MKIIVTGGAGYIGSVCVERLCEAGHEVVVLDNLSEGHRAAVDPRARLEVLDLLETERVQWVLRRAGAEAVIHFAGSALVWESMRDPSKYYRNNVEAGLSLLRAMVGAGVPRLVFSSSCATYGIPERIPIDESTPQRPLSPYGHSKLVFEEMLRWYGEVHGISSVTFRYFNAAGATERLGEDHRNESRIIPLALFVAQGKREAFDLFGEDYDTPDGTAVRDYVHVSDLAEVHRAAVERGTEGSFNLGTGRGASVREVVEACREVSGRAIPVRRCARRPGDPPVLVASIEKARRELDWAPRFTEVREIVRTAWEWHEAHPRGYDG